jgi:hypothetical protein
MAKKFSGDVRVMSRIIDLDPELAPDSGEFWRARFSWKRCFKTLGFITLSLLAIVGLISIVLFFTADPPAAGHDVKAVQTQGATQ